MATEAQYYAVRDAIQYILVPIIFVIGFLGNALSIVVLTRKRMRCSTNIYLTGLAVADIVYLTMLLIMSAQHYKPTTQIAIFWRCRGLFQWLIDGSSYISLYIVVCFTIERYIAVCHPMKGQVFCTEDRAKKVLTIVVLVILLSILSENFEYELVEKELYVNYTTGELCKDELLHRNQTEILLMSSNQFKNSNNKSLNFKDTLNITTTTTVSSNIPDDQYYYDSSTLHPFSSLSSSSDFQNIREENDEIRGVSIVSDAKKILGNIRGAKDTNNKTTTVAATAAAATTTTTGLGAAVKAVNKSGCHYVKKYITKSSPLADDIIYRTVFDIFTIIFYSFLPLILIIIFNTLLIMAVHKSNRLRDKMTNMSVRQIKHQQQEKKITIILIAVVILFIICQTPWAIYLFLDMYTNFMDEYLKRIFGNIFNTLVAIDAASNFILYCVLSDKYRKTLKELLMGYKYKRQDTLLSRQGTLASSWYNYTYKSFKKRHSELSNDNNQSQNERKSIKLQKPAQQRPSSSSSTPSSPTSSQPQTSSSSSSAAAGGGASAATVTTKNNHPSGMSSSFRHNSYKNDKLRLTIRPTVSFHNHPLSSNTDDILSSFNQQNSTTSDIEMKPSSSSPPPPQPPSSAPAIQFHHQIGIGGNRIRQDSIASASENSTNDNHNVNTATTNFLLKPSDSSGSLQRSQSLILQPKTKHSPDCPNFDCNL